MSFEHTAAVPYRPRPLPLDRPPLLLLLPLPLPPLPPLRPPSRSSLYLIGLFSNPTRPPLPDLELLLPRPLHKQQLGVVKLTRKRDKCALLAGIAEASAPKRGNHF